MVLPFVQFIWVRLGNPYRCEVSFFWMPVLLALASFLRDPQAATVKNS